MTSLHTDEEFDRWVQMGEAHESPFPIAVETVSDDTSTVTLTVTGPRAAVWARYFDQTIMGSSWEGLDDDFAYAIITNADDLPAQLKAEGYHNCNFAGWDPPEV